MPEIAYRGRFAPSPTGPLHFGSLVAAVGSFLDARSRGGEWLVRMEDLDPPREVAGAADHILRTLERFGLHWDGDILYQSQRHSAYREILDELHQMKQVYNCGCSRKDIQEFGVRNARGLVYPGTCRDGLPAGRTARSVRLRVMDIDVGFTDRLQGHIRERLPEQVGDFVLQRSDGLFAYQLAVVADDATQGITHVVRGADLLDSTCRQIYLQQSLSFKTPRYLHLPLAVNEAGEKLSKQTQAPPVNPEQAAPWLVSALRFLGQEVPSELQSGGLDELWSWAIQAWEPGKIPRSRRIEER